MRATWVWCSGYVAMSRQLASARCAPTEIDDSTLANGRAQRLPEQPRLKLRLTEGARSSPVEACRSGSFEVVAHGAGPDRARPGYLTLLTTALEVQSQDFSDFAHADSVGHAPWSPCSTAPQSALSPSLRFAPAWPCGRSGPEWLLECSGIRAQVRRNGCSSAPESALRCSEWALRSRRNSCSSQSGIRSVQSQFAIPASGGCPRCPLLPAAARCCRLLPAAQEIAWVQIPGCIRQLRVAAEVSRRGCERGRAELRA